MPTTQQNDEIDNILKSLVQNFAGEYDDNDGGTYWWGHDTDLGDRQHEFTEARESIQRLIVEAEQRGVAWSVMAIDDLHINHADTHSLTTDTDKTYRGIKNSIRDRFRLETGVDPAPYYQVHAQLQSSLKTKQDVN